MTGSATFEEATLAGIQELLEQENNRNLKTGKIAVNLDKGPARQRHNAEEVRRKMVVGSAYRIRTGDLCLERAAS